MWRCGLRCFGVSPHTQDQENEPQNGDSSNGATERQCPVAAVSDNSHRKEDGKEALDAAGNEPDGTLSVDTSALRDGDMSGATLIDTTLAAPAHLSLMGVHSETFPISPTDASTAVLPSLNSARPELAALSMLSSSQNSFNCSQLWGPSTAMAMDQLSTLNSQSAGMMRNNKTRSALGP